MKIRHYKRAFWCEPFGIHRNLCSCSRPTKCCKEWHTTGFSIYLLSHIISIEFDKPDVCDAPF